MRQIKFRGKLINSEQWMYGGYYYHKPTDEQRIIAPTLNVKSILNDWNVQPETVGQFTGLLDRNGKEIYEGDILQDDEIRWEIFWCDDVAAFMAEQYQSESDAPKMFLLSEVAKDSEIIGNIHDQSKS